MFCSLSVLKEKYIFEYAKAKTEDETCILYFMYKNITVKQIPLAARAGRFYKAHQHHWASFYIFCMH